MTEENVESLMVTWEGTEDLPILFVNHIFIRSSQDGFLVSFGHEHGPYVINPTDEELESLNRTTKAVVRLAIPAFRMEQFVDVLNRVWEGYQARLAEAELAEQTNQPENSGESTDSEAASR